MLNTTNHPGNAIQTTKICHFTPIRIAIIKREKLRVGENVEKGEPLYTVDENVN